jgi:putative membrane protein
MLPLALGILTLGLVWLGPLPRLAHASFAAHMTMHMGVVAIAAPLLAYGIAGQRFDPVRRLPRLFSPVPASVVELVVVWAFHAPALHHAARHLPAVRALEQGAFLLSGLLLWLSVLGGDVSQRAARTATGIIALLLTSMHMTLLGALLALPLRPLYGHETAHGAQPGGTSLFGLTPIADQQLGGAIMLLVGGIVYLAGGLWLGARLLRQPQHASGSTP